MGFTIARIVARPATFASWIAMTTSSARIEVSLNDDPRLLAALSTIVAHSARRAGLNRPAQGGFAEAAVDACRDTFPLVNPNPGDKTGMLHVVLQDFHDRVEMAIEHNGEALPTAGLDTFCAQVGIGGQSLSAALQVKKVDRVQYETRDGISRVILIKYTGNHSASHSSAL
jgi:hypothetical protein